MPGGAIVPFGEDKKPPKPSSALALALADQQKAYAKKYEALDDEIPDDIKDEALTSRVKHKFSDDPNWMVDGITGACVCVVPIYLAVSFACVCAAALRGRLHQRQQQQLRFTPHFAYFASFFSSFS